MNPINTIAIVMIAVFLCLIVLAIYVWRKE